MAEAALAAFDYFDLVADAAAAVDHTFVLAFGLNVVVVAVVVVVVAAAAGSGHTFGRNLTFVSDFA